MIAAYHLSRRFDSLSEMRFYGFDSFQGIPTLTVNTSEAKEFPPGTFSASLAQVRRNLVEADVDMNRVELIPGWYSDTLNQETRTRLPLRAAAVVTVDCDVFESTVSVLDFVEPYLTDGSIVIFDDWYCFTNRDDLGEQKALREWLGRNHHLRATPYKEFGWDGKAFIVNRNTSGMQIRVPAAHEYISELVDDSVITRTVEGRINFWNRSAEHLYGWRKEEAIDRVSHNLLRTQFPKPLEEIEFDLLRDGQWEGTLVHYTRDGGRVVVRSRWTLAQTERISEVIEVNRRSTDFNSYVSGFDAETSTYQK
jgi:PAS domain S-box-containing protein